jgi:glycosyltransferase involved in cell wall biosynthesis
MRILIATPSYAPVIGGTETAVRELTRSLRRRGHAADVLTLNMDAKWTPRWSIRVSEEDGGRTIRWGACNPLHGLRTPVLNRLLKRHVDAFVVSRLQHLAMLHVVLRQGIRHLASQYDLVHCHDESDLVLPLVLQPHVMHLHTMSETLPVYSRQVVARRILTHCARAWIANSADSAAKGQQVGIPSRRLQVVPNGVDAEFFVPAASTQQREGILFVGRLVPRKGLDVLLDALKLVGQPLKLRVVGVPVEHEYEQHIRHAARAVERSAPHRVEFLGPQDPGSLRDLYQRAALVVCPSLIEPFGIVALEAMSCGATVVASRVDGLPEVVEDGESGVLVPPGNPAVLAVELERLLLDRELGITLGRQARARVLACFTWERVAALVERVYQSVA